MLFTLNFVVLLSWSLVDPLTWHYEPSSDPTTLIGLCKEKGLASTMFYSVVTAINWAALVLANVQSFKGRNISDKFW